MPNAIWRHRCCGSKPRSVDQPTCPGCGEPGRFVRWELSPVEAMSRYARVYGLKPIGDHLGLAKRLLGPLRDVCEHCDGSGLAGDERGWRDCRVCEGAGGAWLAPEHTLAALRRRVVEEFPDAGAWRPALHFELPPPQPSGRRRGYSPDGLRHLDVQFAFMQAEETLGRRWKLLGRGHCRRVTLRPSYAGKVKRVTSCWVEMVPHQGRGYRAVYPRAIVEEAARMLGVSASLLIRNEH